MDFEKLSQHKHNSQHPHPIIIGGGSKFKVGAELLVCMKVGGGGAIIIKI